MNKNILKFLAIGTLLFATAAAAQNPNIPGITPKAKAGSKLTNIPYTLNPQPFFDNSVSVLVPSSFTLADTRFLQDRFPDAENYPKFVYTDATKKPILSLNVGDNVGDRTNVITFFRDIKNDIRTRYPSSRFLRSDVIKSRTYAIIEVIIPDKKGVNLYNMMAFTYIGKKFFFLNFTVPETDMGMWQDTAREIAENVEILGRN